MVATSSDHFNCCVSIHKVLLLEPEEVDSRFVYATMKWSAGVIHRTYSNVTFCKEILPNRFGAYLSVVHFTIRTSNKFCLLSLLFV